MLLPIYFTVCHRMIPFFTSVVVRGYQVVAPDVGAGGGLGRCCCCHLALELRHGYAWLWLPDVPLAIAVRRAAVAWWPPRRACPRCCACCSSASPGCRCAFALYAAQSVWFAATGEFVLGRAPAHALFIGFFGSLLVAMVTRVTQGHSGRPLVLGKRRRLRVRHRASSSR